LLSISDSLEDSKRYFSLYSLPVSIFLEITEEILILPKAKAA
jgi:hypothetical protein